MYIATIDCGTTNSRIYIVNEKGKIIGQTEKKIGVRDTAIHGDNQVLKEGLAETFYQALEKAELDLGKIDFAISSGMITSEIGLLEIPHLWAPLGMDQLAKNIKKVHDLSVFPIDIPIYFVRGIKNKYHSNEPIKNVGKLDFMRGEETQIAGLFELHDIEPPFTVVVLSSHTKFIPVDGMKNILGSVTTVSGQVYEAIVKETFVGKSVRKDDDFNDENYLDEAIIDIANHWVKKSGFLRSLLMPRFMDTLLETKWYERKLFVESIIASEDLEAIGQLNDFNLPLNDKFVLIGNKSRTLIYEYLLKKKMNIKHIIKINDKRDIDYLSITGSLYLAKLAGLIS
jgi:2-dehydro-3-deoxygalactonokinase